MMNASQIKKGISNNGPFKINNQKVSRTLWKSFSTVLFVPSDLNLFVLGPAPRRKFLDDTLCQISKEYSADLMMLESVLKQRASLLEKIYNKEARASELEIWDEQLAELSVRIDHQRLAFIDFLQKGFTVTCHTLTGFGSDFQIDYKPAAQDKNEFLSHLLNLREAEIRTAQNLVGPHREDFTITKDGQLNIYNSSRGEQRSQILALKFLQAEFLYLHHLPPVILLDDVFSELDETRRSKLVENLGRFQIFIASTEEHHLPKLKQNAQILKVEDDTIS